MITDISEAAAWLMFAKQNRTTVELLRDQGTIIKCQKLVCPCAGWHFHGILAAFLEAALGNANLEA